MRFFMQAELLLASKVRVIPRRQEVHYDSSYETGPWRVHRSVNVATAPCCRLLSNTYHRRHFAHPVFEGAKRGYYAYRLVHVQQTKQSDDMHIPQIPEFATGF